MRGETGDAVEHLGVGSYFWGARTFWGVRFRALVQSQKPSRRTDAHRSSSTRARLSEATTEHHSLGRGSGGRPLSIKPIIMASDNTEDILYTDYTTSAACHSDFCNSARKRERIAGIARESAAGKRRKRASWAKLKFHRSLPSLEPIDEHRRARTPPVPFQDRR